MDAPQSQEELAPSNSIATKLVELAQQRYDFGVSTMGESYAIPKQGARVVSMLRGSSRSFRAQLAREFYARFRRIATQQSLADCLSILEGQAQLSDAHELHLRVARHDSNLWLDLGDRTGCAIRLSDQGWSIEQQVPILFRRSVLTADLPYPTRGGDLSELWDFVNVLPEDRPLIVAFLVAALIETIPHPVLAMHGEQGSGKSTTSKMLVSLIDPSAVPLRKPPRDPESWVTAAAASWVIALDNLSNVPSWLPDSLCRAVSGEGDVRRMLYTDGEHAVFAFRRVMILNYIDLGVLRGDLGDRMLFVTPTPVTESTRMSEEQLLRRWEEARPRILGALLDVAVRVLREMPSIKIELTPRMADFALILAAVDLVQGTRGFHRFLDQHRGLARETLSSDPFICTIAAVDMEVIGSSAELLDRFATPKTPPGWPTSPRRLTQHLRQQAPVMRKAGWEVFEDGGRNRDGITVWTLRPPRRERDAQTSDPQGPQDRVQPAQNGFAGLAGQESPQTSEGSRPEYRL